MQNVTCRLINLVKIQFYGQLIILLVSVFAEVSAMDLRNICPQRIFKLLLLYITKTDVTVTMTPCLASVYAHATKEHTD